MAPTFGDVWGTGAKIGAVLLADSGSDLIIFARPQTISLFGHLDARTTRRRGRDYLSDLLLRELAQCTGGAAMCNQQLAPLVGPEVRGSLFLVSRVSFELSV